MTSSKLCAKIAASKEDTEGSVGEVMTTSHTPGPWIDKSNALRGRIIGADGLTICAVASNCKRPSKEVLANMALIADAGTVAAETGLTPRQLADQRAELLKVVKLWQAFFDTMPKGQFAKVSCDVGLMNEAFITTARAIAHAEGRD